MKKPRPTSRREESRNLATFGALLALVAMGTGLLLLVALVLPKVLWLVVVVLGFVLMGLFHYVTWGWWMLRNRPPLDDEDE